MGDDTPARAYLAHFQRDRNSLHPSCAAAMAMASPMVPQDNLASEVITLIRAGQDNGQEREQARRDRIAREERDRAHRHNRNRGDRDRGDRREDGRDGQGHGQARHGRGEGRGEDRRHRHRDQRPHGKPRRN